MTNSSVPEHEKIFDEICNKLNELSNTDADGNHPIQPKYEQMQEQMKKFNSGLKGSQTEMLEKIKNLESVSYGSETLDAQMKLLADQLSAERANNAKMSSDLAKSLELSLQLQLEIQGLKARALQIQSEEKKYSQSMFERNKILQRDLDLTRALKDETAMEFAKAKSAWAREQDLWEQQYERFQAEIQKLSQEKTDLETANADLMTTIEERDNTVKSLNEEIEKISTSFTEVEASAQQQNEVLNNLTSVAETKIIEMKIALDKKSLEAQDYFSHLQQTLAQSVVLKQENMSLKEYVAKLNYYHQQAQHAQSVVNQIAQVSAVQAQQQVQQQAAQIQQMSAQNQAPTVQPQQVVATPVQ
jgi:chromosome segregation ATPase